MYPEQTEQSQVSLPIISDEAGQRVIEELGMDVDGRTQGIIAGITGESKLPPGVMRGNLALDVFTRIAGVNPDFVRTVQQAIKNNLYAGVAHNRSACAEGMAVVIRAFDVESDFNLVNNFANLQQVDIQRANEIVAQALGGKKEGKDLLEEILETPRIPEQQITLNRVVTKATQASGSGQRQVNLGAAAMYKVLAEMRPKLYPPKAPTPPTGMPPQSGI